MVNLGDGRSVNVLTITPEHTYVLNERVLQEILLRDDVKDKPVAVISIAGSFRTGKSFMLNYFLRYLLSEPADRNSGAWLGADDEVLRGFEWRGGSEAHTTGMLMWYNPIITTMANGDKIAVVLMDTQETFDSDSTGGLP